MYVPSEVFFVTGAGHHRSRVGSFERALRDAGVEPYNLVPVSSVFPPDAAVVEPHEGAEHLAPGQVVHAVLGRDTERDGEARAAVGVARPKEGHGYFVEGDGETGDEAETLAREMVETSEATGDAARSFSVEASADACDAPGRVTAVAAAVLVPPERINGA